MSRARLRLNSATVWLLLLLVFGCDRRPRTPGPTSAARPRRLVILGFDGVDPRWVDRYVSEGKLPTIATLVRANGGAGYRRLASTNPPQSPVAWTTFATGTNPGAHGIFDFIGRRLNQRSSGPPVMPAVATGSFEPQAIGPPAARNARTGIPFWKTLADSGVRVVALNVPYSFPPDPMREGRMLSGLGTPDLRETNSTFIYAGTDVTPERAARPPGGGSLVPITVTDGVGSFSIEGPSTPSGDGRMTITARARATGADTLELELGEARVRLTTGRASDFVELSFSAGGRTVRGITRVLALEAQPAMRIFISPIGFHPRAPYSPFTYPASFAATLADSLGHLYKTVGWDHDTSALNAEVIDEAAFLADVESVERDRTAMLEARLAANDWDLLISVSTATDRVSHMFYRLIDPTHPRYDAALAAQFGRAIEEQYVRMDHTIASVLRRLGPDDTLLVISDHGFHNYRRGLHVNQWLRQNGFLALRNDATGTDREFLLDVDWSRTQAYALGTGQIYLNRRGRERDGIVNETAIDDVSRRIREGLLAIRDEGSNQAAPIREVYLGRTAFHGGRMSDAPDLQIAFADGYRTSWETILGGCPEGLFADNTRKWSGDHAASDVTDTPGILISNRALAAETSIVDLGPTALTYFERPIPASYEGRSVLAGTPSGSPPSTPPAQ